MRLLTLMRSFAAVGGLLILSTPIARAYIHGSNSTWQSPDAASGLKTPPTTASRWEEAGNVLPGAHHPVSEPLKGEASAPIPEPETFPLVSLGLLALGAALWKHRGPQAPNAPARLPVRESR